MKYLLIVAMLMFTGCVQLIVEPDRLQINSFLTTTGFEEFYYDPNGFFEVNKYRGIPSEFELEYNPLTNTYKLKSNN